ncbi:MAG: hypothetical protein ACTHK0_14755 [Ginsengibacter sp.]
MLELIALIFLTREIGRLAEKKGLKPNTWKIYLVIGWIFFELIGIFIGVMTFGMNNLISVVLVGFAFAISSYFLIKSQLNKLPDRNIDDDINNVGRF